MSKEDWPKNKNGKPEKSGRLLNHVSPKFLVDFNHWAKAVGKVVYKLAYMPKLKSMVDRYLAA